MTMPTFNHLPVNVGWGETHANDVFKHQLRSKAEVEAYFNAFAASTVLFSGTENTDYEFDSVNGFRTLTNSGAMEIVISNIITDTEQLKYLFMGNSFEFECLTSEWVEPDLGVWDKVVPYMTGAAAGALDDTYLFHFYNSTNNGGMHGILKDNPTTEQIRGRNRLQVNFHSNATGRSTIARTLTTFNKGTHFKQRLSTTQGCGSGWIDGLPMIPPHAGTVTTSAGPHYCYRSASSQAILDHTTGTVRVFIGNHRPVNSACTRWIRNIRLFNAPTTISVHPKLRNVMSFGDSFSATSLGPPHAGSGFPGSYNAAGYTPDAAVTTYAQQLVNAGYYYGGMYGSGQGGKAFFTTLDSEGWREIMINQHPSFVFTFGMHNDIQPIDAGTYTIAQLRTKLMDDYILPVMQRGCHGWGFVVPAYNQAADTAGVDRIQAHNDVGDMLVGLPAQWDAAYPAYAGKVKVRDLRNTMGLDWANNINWQTYFDAAEVTHPSEYGQILAANSYADMTLEWLAE